LLPVERQPRFGQDEGVVSASADSSLEPPLSRRDRALILGALLLVCALAWAVTARWAAMMDRMELMIPAEASWTAAELGLVFVMWAVMMAAMMLPAASPMIAAFAAINRRRRQRDASYVPTAVFLAGYLLAWSGFSLATTAAQWLLSETGLLSSMMEPNSRALAATLFIIAGLYQWSPLKRACLTQCRSPLGFVIAEWREGARGALVMGLRHGIFCIGCCAGLMLLLFAVAVMDLRWVAALALLVTAEKLLPWPALWRHAIGGGLVLAGIAVAAGFAD
jgi:predicted metal-binding membrane protein